MKSLGTRFLLPFGILILLFSLFVLYRTYEVNQQHAYELVNQQAALALEFNLAIRSYAGEEIRPVVEKLLGKDGFNLQTMSTSYISKSIFEEVRKHFPDYYIRFSSENPRNPSNIANADELAMIEYFRNNPGISRYTKQMEINGRAYLAHFTPKIMKLECLRCHGDPKDTPADLLKLYGSEGSFYRKVGDVAGLDTVAVPIEKVNTALASEMRGQSVILVMGLLILFGSILLVFRSVVTSRLEAIAVHFRDIATSTDSQGITPVKITGNDEISALALAFNKLVAQLQGIHASLEDRVSLRTAELAEVNDELRREIAERKRMEDLLQERSKELEQFFGVTLSLLCIADTNGFFRRVNAAWERTLGYTREELMTTSFMSFVHPEDVQSTLDAIADLASQHEVINFTNRYRCKDGTYRWLEWRSAPVGNLIYAAANDITDRKLAQERLEKAEGLLSGAIVQSPLGILIADAPNVRVQMVNQAALDIRGETMSPLRDIGTADHFPDWQTYYTDGVTPYPPDQLPLSRAILESKISKNVESIIYRANGEKRWISSNAGPIRDRDGSVVAGISVFHDITELKRTEVERQKLEERLRRAEKMEALGTLAGGVAHDMNNVLGVLVGYSELLLEKIPQEGALRRYVDNILQSGLRGAAIIQDLLTLARRGVAIAEVVNLNKVVKDYLATPEFEKIKVGQPRVAFKAELAPDLLNIKGSPVHLGKTIMNLVSNASEAIGDGGEVLIRTENRYLDTPIRGYDEMREGDYVVLIVRDSGQGISPQDLGKIFEPFYTKKVMGRSGTGLGLAVVWGTVKDHDGYIDVQSEEGKGSCFTLYFPVTRDAPVETEKTMSPAAYLGNGESILVVDDVKEQRELAVNMLERLGYRVTAVSGGEEALEYLRREKADLIVLDMIMDPGIDGLETYRRIREILPKQKAVIVSGFSETERVRQAQELGAGAYIRKPYVMEKIGLAVRQELDGGKKEPPV